MLFFPLLIENSQNWLVRKKYVYKNKTYKSFYHFVACFAIETNATKCRIIIPLTPEYFAS
jgi:hypothetical protein